LTDMAEHPRSTAASGTVSVAIDRKANRARSELFNVTWGRCEGFMRLAQPAFMARSGKQSEGTMPGLLGPAFRERLAAAMRIPVVETLCSAPWTAAARRVLPSPSPQMAATAMWAPVIAWCALETLAESIDAEHPETVALEIFEQLRLRRPLADAFASLGFEGESAWRAAARIKIVLLAQKEATARESQREVVARTSGAVSEGALPPEEKVGSRAELASTREPVSGHKPAPTRKHEPAPVVAGLPRALWSDPDVRWLAGVHEAGGSSYLVQEPFEELLWWLQMPAILKLASQSSVAKADTQSFCACIQDSIAEVERAGYKLEALLGPAEELEAVEPPEHAAADSDQRETEKITTEIEAAKPSA
jgi:hypothetical protein